MDKRILVFPEKTEDVFLDEDVNDKADKDCLSSKAENNQKVPSDSTTRGGSLQMSSQEARNLAITFGSLFSILGMSAGVFFQIYKEYRQEMSDSFYQQKATCIGSEIDAHGHVSAVFRLTDNPEKTNVKSRVFEHDVFVHKANAQQSYAIIKQDIGQTRKICEWNASNFKIFRFEQEKVNTKQ